MKSLMHSGTVVVWAWLRNLFHIFLNMRLLIHAGIKVYPGYQKGSWRLHNTYVTWQTHTHQFIHQFIYNLYVIYIFVILYTRFVISYNILVSKIFLYFSRSSREITANIKTDIWPVGYYMSRNSRTIALSSNTSIVSSCEIIRRKHTK